jgi:hypothetical protein
MVNEHHPKDGDIDNKGVVNKERLTEEATKLFKKAQDTMIFVNFYQLRQFSSLFAGYWGFHLSTSNNWALKCFFGKRTSKQHQSVVSPRSQRQRTSLKSGCKFEVVAAPNPRCKEQQRHRTPVRISRLTLEHCGICNPGIKEQTMAKKAAGAYMGNLDLSKMEHIVEMINGGGVSTRSLRNLLKDHLPPLCTITPDDVRNVRMRALKYSLEEKPLDKDAAEKIILFKPLDEDENIILLHSDACRKKVAEFMREVLQDTDQGWKVLGFLDRVKAGTPGFDYRVKKDDTDRPTAIVWMTAGMRRSWIRFGSTIFLDAMKRKLNSLHWPYIGPVAIDHEKRVVPLCECLCLEEALEAMLLLLTLWKKWSHDGKRAVFASYTVIAL